MPEEDIIKNALQKAMNEENDEGKKKTLKKAIDDMGEKDNSTWQGKIKSFLSTLSEKLDSQIKDMTTLDITTMIGDAVEINTQMDDAFAKDFNFDNLKGKLEVVGVTRLDADGDIQELLYGTEGQLKLTPGLLKVHKDNVMTGVETWNRYWRNLLEVVATVAAIVDPTEKSRVELVRALRTNLEPLGKAPKIDTDDG